MAAQWNKTPLNYEEEYFSILQALAFLQRFSIENFPHQLL